MRRRNRGAPRWLGALDKALSEALGKAWPGPTPAPWSPGPTHIPRRIRGTWKDTTASFWRTTNSKGAPFCLFRTFTDTLTPSVCKMTQKCPSVKPTVTNSATGTHGSRDCELCPPSSRRLVLSPSRSRWGATYAPSSARAAPRLQEGLRGEDGKHNGDLRHAQDTPLL